MLTTRSTTIFPDNDSADRYVKDLRQQGVPDDKIAVITRHQTAGAAAAGAAEGLAAGAGVGALFGLAAVAIPGVGPFITAGWLASTLGLTGGAAAAGAIVGGSAGLLAGALAKAGYAKKEADFYAHELDAGRVVVAVEQGAPLVDTALTTTYGRYGGWTYRDQ